MSPAEPHRPGDRDAHGRAAHRGIRPSIVLPTALAIAIVTALLPLTRVLEFGGWFVGATAMVVVVLAVGWTGRRLRLPAVATTLAELVAGVILLTAGFFRSTAALGLIPTPATIRAATDAIGEAVTEIAVGVAPMPVSTEVAFVLVAAGVVLAVALDHVVLTARMPLLASIALIAVQMVPALVLGGDVRARDFVPFAAAMLLLLAVETRDRERTRTLDPDDPHPLDDHRPPRRPVGIVTTAGLAIVAITATLIVAPALPQPQRVIEVAAVTGIDASLSLGDDLRQPAPTEVLAVTTSATRAPYLRVATLSNFDGRVWKPDDRARVPLTEGALPPVVVDEGVELSEATTAVEVRDYISAWLPVPFPAVDVTGLDGDWEVDGENRTLLTSSSSPRGQDYAVTTTAPNPTLEQIRAARATQPGLTVDERESVSWPRGAVTAIREAASEVTADAASDYDRLIALQSWFRSSFDYSLEAPVEQGFDGSGVEAIAIFLRVREGYCVHFASAFAVMARMLGMPSRVVVGYLPGTATDEKRLGQTVYSVQSTQLHAWPEVYFQGVGWVPFEPTASLGEPTRFTPGSTGSSSDPSPEPTAPSATPSATATARADDPDQDTSSAAASGAPRNPLPTLGVLLAILAVLAAPALARLLIRRRRLAHPDPSAAWAEVVDTARDLGLDLPFHESPRILGRHLVDHGADRDAIATLVSGIELVSYGPADAAAPEDVVDAAQLARAGLLAAVPRGRAFRAAVAPVSLVRGALASWAPSRAG